MARPATLEPQSRAESARGRVAVVVPCFDEEERFDIEAFNAYLQSNDDVDFVLVDDGSRDRTRDVLERLAARWPRRVRVVPLERNVGKGEAVRSAILGVLSEPYAYVGYWDADLATPLAAIDQFAACLDLREDVDVVLGARVALLGRRIRRKATRHYFGRVFATMASLVLDLPVYDTQCGAKMFRVTEDSKVLFTDEFCSRWIFDVEIIARYVRSRPGKEGIYELPLDQWIDVGESKVRTIDFVRAVGEMATIFRTYRLPKRYRTMLSFLWAPFTRYAGAGAVGTGAHYVTLVACVEIGEVSPTLGTVLGASVGALVNYLLNYHLTFASRRPHLQTVPRFFIVAVLGLLLNAAIMHGGVRVLGVHYLVVQVVATAVVLAVGYGLNKVWTFGLR